MKDEIVLLVLIVGFAAAVTAHVAIVFGLAFRSPRWRAPVALLVLPLAPYWAARERMRLRAGVWIASLAVYGIARLVALR